MLKLLRYFFNPNEKQLRSYSPVLHQINDFESEMQQCSDEELRNKTQEFKKCISEEEMQINDLLPEVYAVIREVGDRRLGMLNIFFDDNGFDSDLLSEESQKLFKKAKQQLNNEQMEFDDILLPAAFYSEIRKLYPKSVPPFRMRCFDVQLIGAMALHDGKIIEMKTGEGKTLTAAFPAYLNALCEKGVHIITVNDYLAERDSQWMGKIYRFMGLTVGTILNSMNPQQRFQEYRCDITYGTNNEFGFDYLRDNMVIDIEDCVQPHHFYAIIDEVDSILIDEARTPLIISGPTFNASKNKYRQMQPIVQSMVRKQNSFVNDLLLKTAQKIESENEEAILEAGGELFLATKGAPKNQQLLKLLERAECKKLTEQAELFYLEQKKESEHTILDELYFIVDEKGHNVEITERGRNFIMQSEPGVFNIPDIDNQFIEEQNVINDEYLDDEEKQQQLLAISEKYQGHQQEFLEKSEKVHNISQLLKAYVLFRNEVDYVIKDNKIVIVDEFTGRLMPGRRYSDGLHSALEAKEKLRVEGENQTLATITLQNYFRMYEKLSGMTGTAETEAKEFKQIYKTDVLVVPTNKEVIRKDYSDIIYRTEKEKDRAVIQKIVERHSIGQPVLVGTVSIEKSEQLGKMLSKEGVKCNILNAKHHRKEAEIVATAGEKENITIATNMAGRGTDIKLGTDVVNTKCKHPDSNETWCCISCKRPEKANGCAACFKMKDSEFAAECKKECKYTTPCGLFIIGTERHESRRIDNQLRGRSGRQGDPGGSVFFLSLEDDLMRLFGSANISAVMERFGMEEDEPIDSGLITKAIERAQGRVESRNFQIRKNVLEYDDVMNIQRTVIYEQRRKVLEKADLKESILSNINDIVEKYVNMYLHPDLPEEEWNFTGLINRMQYFFLIPFHVEQFTGKTVFDIQDIITEKVCNAYMIKEKEIGEERLRQLERMVILQVVDNSWKEHLCSMDDLQEGIHLRAHGQRDPLVEYKKEAFGLFQELVEKIKEEIIDILFKIQLATHEDVPEIEQQEMYTNKGEDSSAPQVRKKKKVGRNDPCPCGSGKKYKKCCGKN